jgi:hypothetical protein
MIKLVNRCTLNSFITNKIKMSNLKTIIMLLSILLVTIGSSISFLLGMFFGFVETSMSFGNDYREFTTKSLFMAFVGITLTFILIIILYNL